MGDKEPLDEFGYQREESDGLVIPGLVGRFARAEDGDDAAHFPQHRDLDGIDKEIYDHGEVVESRWDLDCADREIHDCSEVAESRCAQVL